ncbi:MAG: hypothetical protein HZA46_23560 [Planctomycetales bacterium]|nr:hypothetical protein [Planctomycetales bacterium]
MRFTLKLFVPFVVLATFCSPIVAQEAKPAAGAITPEAVNLGRPVDFEKDVYPILDANCVSCHNVAITENGLNLEDHKGILKGGKRGMSIVAKDPDKSLLYLVASRAKQPAMPPLPNKVEAKALTPKELGILKQWILEGATPGSGMTDKTILWQPLPKGFNPIFSVALSSDGQYVACGRANRITVYHIPSGDTVAELTDPALLAIQHNGKPMYEAGASHRDFVHALTFSPDGRTLASAGFREVKLWNRPLNVQKFNLAASTGSVAAVAVSPDNKWLATASADFSVKVWNLENGQAAKSLVGHTALVSGLTFSPDGTKLLSSSHDKSVRVWNPIDGALLSRIDAPSPLNGVAVTPDGTKLVTAGADNLLRVWEFSTASPTKTLSTPAAPVLAVRVSPDKKLLALGEADGKVTLIDLATGQVAKALAGHTGAITSVAFSANSARLVSGSADKTTRVWDVATGQVVATITAGPANVESVALHANGNQAATGFGDGRVAFWKLDVADPAGRAFAGDNGAPAAVVAVSPDGKLHASAGVAEAKPAIIVRDIATGNVVKALPGHEGPVTAIAFRVDNLAIVSGSADKTARVWNLADGKELAKFAVHTNTVTAVAFHPNGQQVVSGAADNSLKLWNVADAKELANCAGHTGAISGVAFHPNGSVVISASADATIRTWNPANGTQAASFPHGQPVTALALSRDGAKFAASGTDQTNLKLYQLDGKLLFTLAGHAAAIKSLNFSADNLRLVTGGADNAAIVWDAATGALLESLPIAKGLAAVSFGTAPTNVIVSSADKSLTLLPLHIERLAAVGHTMAITGLSYNAAGDAIFTSSLDGTARRFVTATGAQAFAATHGAPIHDLAQSADGQWLATAGENNLVKIWNASNGAAGPKTDFAGFTAPVKSVTFTGDNLRVLAGSANNQVLAFNLATGLVEQLFLEHAGAVEALAVAGEKGTVVVSSSADKTVRSWSLAVVRQLAGHTGPVNAVAAISNAPTQIVSGSEDGSVRVWDLTNGNMVRQMAHGGPVTSIAVRPDALFIASASANNTARLWNAANGQQVAELRGDLTAQRQAARSDFDVNDAKNVVTAATAAVPVAEKNSTEKTDAQKKANEAKVAAEKTSTEMAAKAKEATDKAVAAKTAADAKKDDAALQKAYTDAQKVADDATAAAKNAVDDVTRAAEAITRADTAVKIAAEGVVKAKATLEAATAAQKQREESAKGMKDAATAKEKPIRAIAFSRDGKELATAGDDGLIHTWDATTGVPLDLLAGHAGPVVSLAYTTNKLLVSGSADQTAKVWNLRPAWALAGTLGPKKETPLEVGDSPFVSRVLSLAFSPDGAVLATGGGDPSRSGEVTFWNVGPQTLIKNLTDVHSDTVYGMEFSRDGKLLVTGAADKFVKLIDIATGKPIKQFEGHTHHVLDVTMRPDAKIIASAGADNVIKIWDVETGEQQRTIQGFTKQVTSIQYLGRGAAYFNQIVSCSGDKTVRFHQADNGNNFRSFAGSTDYMYAATAWVNELKDADKLVIAGGQDGTLRIWNGENGTLVKSFDPPKPPEVAQQAAK